MGTESGELVTWIRWTLAGVMAVASLGKIMDRDSFTQAVINYQVIPRHASRIFARFVPWLELGATALLLSGRWVAVGALLSGFLLLSFSIAAAINIVRGRRVSCGCMGKLTAEQVGGPLLFRNALLMGLVLVAGLTARVQADVPSADWFPLGTLVVTSVAVLTLLGPGWGFMRQAFFPTANQLEHE